MASDTSKVQDAYVKAIQRRVRIVLLLDASREAGIEPLPTSRLHLIAYLANVLSPVWDMDSFVGAVRRVNGSILKQRSGPFYPDLQGDLDRLVGMGVAEVESLAYREIDDGRFRLDGRYRLNRKIAEPILAYVGSLADEGSMAKYIRELVLALSSLSDEEIDEAATEDATYSDSTVGMDNVIDFGEWLTRNDSTAAAIWAGKLIESGVAVGPSENVHLYVRHLRRRLRHVG